MSLRRRFTLLAALAVTGTVLVVGLGLYFVFAHQLQAQLDDRLRSRAQTPRGFAITGRFDPGFARFYQRPGVDNVFVMVVDPNQCALLHTANADQLGIQVPADVRLRTAAGADQFVTVSSGGTDYRLLVTRVPNKLAAIPQQGSASQTTPGAPAPAPSPGCASAGSSIDTSSQGGGAITQAQLDSSVLVVGATTQGIQDALAPLRWILAAAAGASLLLGAAAGWLAARRALRPVTRLSDAVDHIGHGGDLTRRLPPPRTRDEVAVLTDGFNASLDRIETAYRELEHLLERQRQFVGDASHELRTPLTTLRSDMAMLHRHPDMRGTDHSALVERSLAEVERMTKLASDLLALARSDAGAMALTPVDWDAVAADAADDVRRLVEPRSVRVTAQPLGDGEADADAVRRVVRVLAENVARHTPPSTTVTLDIRRDGADAVIAVADDGPGVDAALIPVMFDRFVRGDPARSGPGTGLGLAIARGLVEGHGGSVRAGAVEPHGLLIEAHIPLRSRAAQPPEATERAADGPARGSRRASSPASPHPGPA